VPAGADSPAPRGGSERFEAQDRVRKRFEYRHVQSTGQRVHSASFVWLVAAGLSPAPASARRLGVTVTRKVAGAVGRNRIKRVVRETFRRHRDVLPAGVDLVVIAKREAAGLDYARCRRELDQAAPALARAARRATRGSAT